MAMDLVTQTRLMFLVGLVVVAVIVGVIALLVQLAGRAFDRAAPTAARPGAARTGARNPASAVPSWPSTVGEGRRS
jgi:hypothetical protein